MGKVGEFSYSKISQRATEKTLFWRNTLLEEVYFDFGSKKLSKKSKEKLMKLLKERIPERILLVGYTDNRGTMKSNTVIAKARANEVQKFLTKYGASTLKIKTKGVPMSNYKNENQTEVERKLNRRVEIISQR